MTVRPGTKFGFQSAAEPLPLDQLRQHSDKPSLQMCTYGNDDDDDGQINFSMALSPKTTRTCKNKPKQ